MPLLLEHPVRVYMLAQPERTVRISRGRREDARQHEREKGGKRTGDAGGSEVSYTCEGKRGCEGSVEGMTERKGAWDSGCTKSRGDREEVRAEREGEGSGEREGYTLNISASRNSAPESLIARSRVAMPSRVSATLPHWHPPRPRSPRPSSASGRVSPLSCSSPLGPLISRRSPARPP